MQRTNAHPLVLALHALSILALMERRPCVSLSEPGSSHSQKSNGVRLVCLTYAFVQRGLKNEPPQPPRRTSTPTQCRKESPGRRSVSTERVGHAITQAEPITAHYAFFFFSALVQYVDGIPHNLPPSVSCTAPVTYAPPLPTRYSTAAAISSGVPWRPAGTWEMGKVCG